MLGGIARRERIGAADQGDGGHAETRQEPAAHRNRRQQEGVRRSQGDCRKTWNRRVFRPPIPLLGTWCQREHERPYQAIHTQGVFVRWTDE